MNCPNQVNELGSVEFCPEENHMEAFCFTCLVGTWAYITRNKVRWNERRISRGGETMDKELAIEWFKQLETAAGREDPW
jgi:hypothetical protein